MNNLPSKLSLQQRLAASTDQPTDQSIQRWIEPLLLGLALLFNGLGALSLHLQGANFSVIERSPLAAFGVFACVVIALRLWLDRVVPARDPLLLPAVVLLSGWGLLTLARVAPNFLLRQTAWVCVGLLMCGVVAGARNQLRWLYRFKYTWLLLAFGLLLATLVLGVNPAGTGARLWLSIGSLFLQPSEVLRLFMIAFLAAFLSERLESGSRIVAGDFATSPLRSVISTTQALAPSVLMWLIAVVLLFSQQDLGAAVLLLGTFITMLYLATGRKRLPLGGLAVLVLAGTAGYFVSARVAQRIDIWLNPWADAQNTSFQIVQSLIAIANGHVFGQGLGQGRPEYVPAVHTDFPFAAIGEEFGLIGMLVCIAVLGVLAMRGWRISQRASSSYLHLLAGGISAALALQAFVIIGGNMAVVPLTGVTLPFISLGGSSLLVSFISVGLLIQMSAMQPALSPRPKAQQRASSTRASQAKLPTTQIRRRLVAGRAGHNLMVLSTTLLSILALASANWGVLQAGWLVARQDNPRRVEAERAIARGAILSRDGTPLAYSLASIASNTAPAGGLREPTHFVRTYPDTAVVSAVGYYSERYGTSGLEAFADPQLRGPQTWLDQMLHRPQVGLPLHTTLDPTLQHQLAQALQNHKGGAIALNWQTGEVLALVSAPSFDPNRLDDDWEKLREDRNAPLINRVTQGLYQPGTFLPALYADLQPATTHALSRTIPLTGFEKLRALNLHVTVTFELANTTTPFPATPTLSETLGQGNLRVTPLRMAATCAALLSGHPITLSMIHSSSAPPALPAIPTMTANSATQADYTGACQHHLGYAEVGVGQRAIWLAAAHPSRPWLLVLVLEQPAALRDWQTAAQDVAKALGFNQP